MKIDSKIDPKKENPPARPNPSRERPEERSLLELFQTLTGIAEPSHNTPKEKKSNAQRWYQPIRRMIALANGKSQDALKCAVAKMRHDGLTIAAPASVESVFNSEYGASVTSSAPSFVDVEAEYRLANPWLFPESEPCKP